MARWKLSMFAVGLAGLAACGGGGGGGGPTTLLAFLRADLRGSEQVPVADADARAATLLEVYSDGTLRFAGTGEAAWTGAVTGLHVHRVAGGAVVADLLAGGGAFDGTTHTAVGAGTIQEALAQEIASDPSAFYVDVHTTSAAAGLARGSLAPFAGMEIHAVMRGSEETSVADPQARGAATLRIGVGREVTWMLAMESPAYTDVTSAHLHEGAAGVNGPIVLDFDVPGALVDFTTGVRSGSIPPLDLPLLSRLAFDPGAFYVNTHTALVPAGVARGQTRSGTIEFWASLSGDEETTVVDPAARGGVTLHFTSFTAGRAHLAAVPLPFAPAGQDIASVIGAHVHRGPAGQDGAIQIDLQAGADYGFGASTGSAEGAISATQEILTRLLASPRSYYANLHTAAAPNGLTRGQLTQDPVKFAADLRGTNEVPPGDPNASGVLSSLLLRGVSDASFTIRMVNPVASLVTGAHVHDGVAGVNGLILIDLTGSPNLQVAGDFLTGDVLFTGRTFARMLAFPEGFYCNVHSAADPDGAARGQLVRIANDSAPVTLTYASPVTYATGSPITPNVPTSTGGTITSYTVDPALPAGLVLNGTTGIISGTPSAPTAAADYTVTGTNAFGSVAFVIDLEVVLGVPTNLRYTTPVTYVKDTAISPNVPTSGGGAITAYAVSPTLPAGLSLNATTGVISGTPTTTSTATNYVVTGSNSAGSTNATVSITVVEGLQAPVISYTTPVSYATGYAIAANTPTTNGPVDSFAVSPALPAGLTLNTTTGAITGTPTTTQSAANYTVTATNAAGSGTATVNITVTLGAPTNLSYSPANGIGYVTPPTFTTMTPSSEGGAVASYSISPALPNGIALNTGTGTISGSPTVTSNQTTYTITATNATGSTTATVTIAVYP